MNFTMELRSRRSRSKTPVAVAEILPEQERASKTFETVITRTTYSNVYPSEITDNGKNNSDHSTKEQQWQNVDNSIHISSADTDEVTSTSSSIYQNISNEILENSQSYESSGSGVSAIDVYRAAGDYWNKFPKTDYTYSVHSKDRKEISPGVIAMPNMSRQSLHRYSTQTTENYLNSYKAKNFSKSFLQDEVDNFRKTTAWVSSAKTEPRTLFSNNHHTNSYKQKEVSSYQIVLFKRFSTALKNMVVTTLTFFYFIYTIQNSVLVWLGKKIHRAATRLMLWDTWLLRTNVARKPKLNSILALCLIPLLLFGGWWLFYGLDPVSYIPVRIHSYESSIQKNTGQTFSAMLTTEQVEAITKLLANPYIQDILNNKQKNYVGGEVSNNDNVNRAIEYLKEDILKIEANIQNYEKSKNSELHNLAENIHLQNSEKLAHLTYQLNRCCRSSYTQVENHVIRILKDLLGAPHYLATPHDISKWLHSTFVAKNDLEDRLNNLTEHLQSDYRRLVEDNSKLIMETVMDKVLMELNTRLNTISKREVLGELNVDSLTDEYIKKIVQNTLEVYDADKTGLVDYALESAGGQILSTRCTESYHARTAVFSLLGIPLWYLGNTPRTVIKPGVAPGECWAFQNFPGFVIIKLAAPIKIEAFSLEHISKLLAPNGKIDSAPKDFSVYGLKNETDKEPTLLGQYKYVASGPSLQYFESKVPGLVWEIVELRVHSNYGNPNYTCLYRFRVHGILSNEPT